MQDIRRADDQEAVLSSSYNLPPDPLLGHERGTPINLPLVAYCYLLRRLTVGQHVYVRCAASDSPLLSSLLVTALSVTKSCRRAMTPSSPTYATRLSARTSTTTSTSAPPSRLVHQPGSLAFLDPRCIVRDLRKHGSRRSPRLRHVHRRERRDFRGSLPDRTRASDTTVVPIKCASRRGWAS